MYKTLLKSHKDFENWKVYNVDNNGNLIPDNLEEKEPKQYPCIILEDDYYGSDFYAFIYLTDFDEYFNGYEKPESPFKLNETVITDDGQMGTVDEIIWSPIDGRYTYNVSFGCDKSGRYDVFKLKKPKKISEMTWEEVTGNACFNLNKDEIMTLGSSITAYGSDGIKSMCETNF